MAVELESANLVRQQVKQALANAHPAVQAAFEALQRHLASQGRNPDLQFIAFNDAQLTTATGYSPIGAACTFYGVYFKKTGTAAGTGTDSWLTIGNAATNTVDDTKLVALHTSVANDEVYAIYPKGIAFGTDLTLSGETSAQDGTESTAGDSGNGFVIIGAA
jgi:Fe-S cluster assembly scaffold protein SufB